MKTSEAGVCTLLRVLMDSEAAAVWIEPPKRALDIIVINAIRGGAPVYAVLPAGTLGPRFKLALTRYAAPVLALEDIVMTLAEFPQLE